MLLVIHFLQRRRLLPVLDGHSLKTLTGLSCAEENGGEAGGWEGVGKLLWLFFGFYGNSFDPQETRVSITGSQAQSQDTVAPTTAPAYAPLYIEDPFDSSDNPARNVSTAAWKRSHNKQHHNQTLLHQEFHPNHIILALFVMTWFACLLAQDTA